MSSKFDGLYPALVTPYDSENNVNYDMIVTLTNHLIDSKVNGLFITGTTGEVFLLSAEERKKIIQTVIKTTNKRIGVIAQIGFLDTKETIEMAMFAEREGVDAISVLPPIYFRYQPKEIINFYKEVCASVKIPVFIYDIPACTGIELLNDEYMEIFDIENVIGVKASHQNLALLKKLREKYPNDIIYIGSDEIFIDALKIGVNGAVGSTYNIAPEHFLKLIKAYNKGDYILAQKLQDIANKFIFVLCKCGGAPAVKYVLSLQGYDVGECRKPFYVITDNDKKEIAESYQNFLEEEKKYEI